MSGAIVRGQIFQWGNVWGKFSRWGKYPRQGWEGNCEECPDPHDRLRVAVMICDAMVNTQTHRQLSTRYTISSDN